MRHPRPYFEFDLTSGGAHPLRHAQGIIEEDLIAADLDERGRQSGRVGIKRRRMRLARIGAGEIIVRLAALAHRRVLKKAHHLGGSEGASMTKIVTDFPLFSCLVVFVCGIVLAAATLLI